MKCCTDRYEGLSALTPQIYWVLLMPLDSVWISVQFFLQKIQWQFNKPSGFYEFLKFQIKMFLFWIAIWVFGASLEYSSQWCDNRFLDSKERFIENTCMWDT